MKLSMMNHAIVLSALMWIVGGCAKMDVQVAIFNHRYYPYSADMVESVKTAAADIMRMEAAGTYNQWRGDLKVRFFEALESSPEIMKKYKETPAPIDSLIDKVEKQMDEGVAEARKHHLDGLAKWREAQQNANDVKLFESRVVEAFSLINKGNAILRGLPVTVRSTAASDKNVEQDVIKALNLPKTGPTANLFTGRLVSAATKASTTSVAGLVADAGLHGDRLASYIIHAPEEAWDKDINRTKAFGGMGNTDIAIKMESLGEFTIKGVRVDAQKVTKATFTVVKQAIQLIAAANGIVVPGSGAAGAPVAPDSAVVGQVGSADQDVAVAQEKARNARQAAISLFDAVVQNRAGIAGDEAARKKAIQDIKSAYAGLKDELAPASDTKATASGNAAASN